MMANSKSEDDQWGRVWGLEMLQGIERKVLMKFGVDCNMFDHFDPLICVQN